MRIKLTINKKTKTFDIPPNRMLINLLRSRGLWSVKRGCETGDCGSCTVIVNGLAVNSCIRLAVQADGKSIETFESLETANDLARLYEAFMDFGAIQCEFCIPGMIMSIKALMDKNPEPTEEEVHDAIVGNFCYCTRNRKPINAIMEAMKKMRRKW